MSVASLSILLIIVEAQSEQRDQENRQDIEHAPYPASNTVKAMVEKLQRIIPDKSREEVEPQIMKIRVADRTKGSSRSGH